MIVKQKIITYGLAQVIDRLISFFLVPLLLLLITVEEYAIWSQIIITVGVLTPILSLGIPQALVKLLPDVHIDKNKYFADILLKLSIIVSIFVILVIINREYLAFLIFADVKASSYLFVIAMLIAIESLFETINAKLRFDGKIRFVSILLTVRSVNRLASVCGMLVLTDYGLLFATYIYVFTNLVIIAYAARRHLISGDLYFYQLISVENLEDFCKLLKSSVPFIPIAIVIAVGNFSDRYFITHLIRLEALTTYSITYSFAATSALIYSTLGYIMYPVLSKNWKQADLCQRGTAIFSWLSYYIYCIIPLILGYFYYGSDLIRVLSGSSIIPSSWLCLLLVVSTCLFGLSQLFSYAVILEHGPSKTLSIHVIAAIVNLALNLIFIGEFGLVGAALASCISNTIRVTFMIYKTSFITKLKIEKRFIIEAITAVLFLWICIFIVDQILYSDELEYLLTKILIISLSYFIFIRQKLNNVKITEVLT